MFSISKKVLYPAIVVLVMISLFAAFQAQSNQVDPAPEVSSVQKSSQTASTLEVTSGREPNAWVSGSVTYRERITLSPGAKLEVEIYDATYPDGPSPTVALQTISNPGEVPIEYRVGYNRDDVDPRNLYAVTASIYEEDGRLAFINDKYRFVITQDYPSEEDMVLILVNPPPGYIGDM